MKTQIIAATAGLALGTLLGWSLGAARHGEKESHPHAEEHAPGAREEDHEQDGEHGSHEGKSAEGEGAEPGVIADSILAEAGIDLDTAREGVIAEELALPGAVRHDQSRASKVSARFPGALRSWKVRAGDRVREGDLLGTVESDATLEPYEVRAPRGGTVVHLDASLGQAVAAGQVLAEVVDLGAVAIDLKVGARDLPRVRAGQAVAVRLDGGEIGAHGRLAVILPGVDPATQTRTARLVVDNPRGGLAEGQFVQGLVEVGRATVRVAVPRASVQSSKGRDVVYVREDGRFEERRVVLGRRDAAFVEVVSGLRPGEQIAAAGSFVVKADLGKSEAGHEH